MSLYYYSSVSEEISDFDTFLSIDDDDFDRLKFTTGLRKKIKKLQLEQTRNVVATVPDELQKNSQNPTSFNFEECDIPEQQASSSGELSLEKVLILASF